MKYLKFLLISIFGYAFYVYIFCFNSNAWKRNSSVDQLGLRRHLMVDDLVNNVLKNGMAKSEVLELLGEPHVDAIQCRLPKDLIMPDSIKSLRRAGQSKEERRKNLDKYLNWSKYHSIDPDTILTYPAGFSLIDQNFLIIKLDGNNLVRFFMIGNS